MSAESDPAIQCHSSIGRIWSTIAGLPGLPDPKPPDGTKIVQFHLAKLQELLAKESTPETQRQWCLARRLGAYDRGSAHAETLYTSQKLFEDCYIYGQKAYGHIFSVDGTPPGWPESFDEAMFLECQQSARNTGAFAYLVAFFDSRTLLNDLHVEAAAGGTKKKTHSDEESDDGETLKRVLATMDNTQAQILAIANKSDLTVTERMRAICSVDQRFYGKESPGLAQLLDKTEGAIRNSEWWKIDRPAFLERAE